jgi:hypothetical protein
MTSLISARRRSLRRSVRRVMVSDKWKSLRLGR